MATQNYTLGRGKLFFAPFLPGTQEISGERYLGNTPEWSATIEAENLDHFSSDEGIKELDESIVLSSERTGSFTTDSIRPQNIALFFFGSHDALTVLGEEVTDEKIIGLSKDTFYQLGQTKDTPVGARNLVTLDPVADPPALITLTQEGTPLVHGEDFEIDMATGRIQILEKAPNVVNGADGLVSYKFEDYQRDRIMSGNQPVEGALRYVAANPAGENFDWFMPWVKLAPNGDYALKGDDWQTIPFSVRIMKRADRAAIYVDGRAKFV